MTAEPQKIDARENKAVLVGSAIAGVPLLVAFAIMMFFAPTRDQFQVVLRLAPLVVGAILLQLTLSRARRHREQTERWRRLLAPQVLAGLAVVLVLVAVALVAFDRSTNGMGLAAVCAGYLAIGQFLAETRAGARAGAIGIKVGAVAAIAFVVGLGVCWLFSGWAFALVAFALLVAPVAITLLSEVIPDMGWWKQWKWPLTGAGVVAALVGAWWLQEGLAGLPPEFALVFILGVARADRRDRLEHAGGRAAGRVGSRAGRVHDARRGAPALLRRRAADARRVRRLLHVGRGRPAVLRGHQCRARERVPAGPDRLCAAHRRREGERARAAQVPGLLGRGGAGCARPNQIPAAKGLQGVRMAIISLGGNDVGFAEIGEACLAPGSCAVRGQFHLDLLRDLPGDLEEAYAAVKTALPGVPVVAIPYPQPLNEVRCKSSPLTPAEFAFVPAFIAQLNGVVRAAAHQAGFYYLGDMADALKDDGRRLCDASGKQPGIKYVGLKSLHGDVDQVLFPRNWIHNSLHPNEDGHQAMFVVLQRWLGVHEQLTFPANEPHEPDEDAFKVAETMPQLYASAPADYCKGPQPRRYCDRENVHEWTLTQLAGAVWDATPAVALFAAGSWVLWLVFLGWTRPLFTRVGDTLADWFSSLSASRRVSPRTGSASRSPLPEIESLNSRMPWPTARPAGGRRLGPSTSSAITSTMTSSMGPMLGMCIPLRFFFSDDLRCEPYPQAGRRARAATGSQGVVTGSRGRRRQREGERLGVGAGTQRVGRADGLLERHGDRVVADRALTTLVSTSGLPLSAAKLAVGALAVVALACSGCGSENAPLTSLPGSGGAGVGDREGRVAGGGDDVRRDRAHVLGGDARDERAEVARASSSVSDERRRHGAARAWSAAAAGSRPRRSSRGR